MNEEATYNLIERYLNDTLTTNEKLIVQDRLQNDPEFYKEVAAHRAANAIIVDNALLDIKKALKKIHTENSTKRKINHRKLYYGLGALFITLSAIGILMFQKNIETQLIETKVPEKSVSDNTPFHAVDDFKNEQDGEKVVIKENEVKNTTEKIVKTEKKASLETVSKNNSAPEIKEKETFKEQNQPEENKSTFPVNLSQLPKADDETPTSMKEGNPEASSCNDIMMEPKVFVTASCVDQKNGVLLFDYESLTGLAPFEFSIDGGKIFYSTPKFSNLGTGNYSIVVKDRQGCKSKSSVHVAEEDCNAVIYPQQQKYWQVPLERFEGQQVLLKIMNGRTGEIVYQKKLSLPSSYTWNGMDENNNPLLMGVYVYELSTSDPSQTLTGKITIIK